MNNGPDLIGEIVSAYERKLLDVEKVLIPRLKDNFLLFHALYKAIYDQFIQKGILKLDPYKNERHLSDIYVPEDLPKTETETDEELPIRLSEYDNLLDFLNNYTQFKVEALSLKRLKQLSGILKFIEWTNLTPTSTRPITRGVAILAEKIKLGSDNLAAGSLVSGQNKLDQTVKLIMKDLKALADFKREEYKLFMRQRIVAANPAFQREPSKEEFIKLIRIQFPRAMEGEAFFPEVVGELHEDLYRPDASQAKAAILEKFYVDEPKRRVDKQTKFNLRDILWEAVRGLGTASRHLDESVSKLIESEELLRSRPKTLMEKFRAWIISLSQGKNPEISYEIEIVDPNTTMKKSERIAFHAFCQLVQKKARYYSSLLVKTSPVFTKLEAASEDRVFEFVEQNLVEIKGLMERLDALDTYFKTEAAVAERNKMRGIKVELGNLKNATTLVNQKLHEYVARKDELEQLKKLGIDVNS